MTVSQIEILEQNVKQLSPSELSAFRAWFIDFDAAEWDRQMESDSATGKLDRLAQSALEEHRNKRGRFYLLTWPLHRLSGTCFKISK